jgi:polo-like kinase 1
MSSRTSRRGSQDNSSEPQIIEEKIVKVNGDIAIKRYSKGRFLGKGGFARVYEFLCLDTRVVSASKVIPKASLTKARARQKLMAEIKIHRSLNHQSIVRFEHFFEDSDNVYILLELCANNTLNELVRRRKRLTEIEVQCYLVQTINAVKYLHHHRVIHRDLKLGNLFLTDKMEIKVGDFGLATRLEFEGERKRTICGTPNYIAPEVLDGRQGHSYEVDTWSIGVIAYTLLVGRPPFETSDVKTTYKRIRMNAYSFPEHIYISQEAKALITRILHSEPTGRPSLDEVLAHPFFHKNAIPKLLPASTLAVPPSSAYLKQFQKTATDEAASQNYRMGRPEVVTARPARSSSQPNLHEQRNETNEDEGRATQRDRPEKLNERPKEIQTERATERNSDRISERTDKTSTRERAISNSSRKSAAVSSYNPTDSTAGPEVWVKKWVDYSNKYGLGYLLSNSCAGVFFNDSTKIVCDPSGTSFQYTQRNPSTKEDESSLYSVNDFPHDLHKKVTLLQHFRSHLLADDKVSSSSLKSPFPYIKKWMRSTHAVIFRMSNKIVQVCFTDHTELLLCSDSRQVTYVNKKAEISLHPLSSAMESSNAEMSKRLRYTKEVLASMLNPATSTGGTGSYRNPLTERS